MEEEKERIPLCPICLEILTTSLYFTSDNHLYRGNCFDKLNVQSRISKQDFRLYLPVNELVIGKV